MMMFGGVYVLRKTEGRKERETEMVPGTDGPVGIRER